MQSRPDIRQLGGRESCTVAADSLVGQAVYAIGAVDSTPVHQAGSAASRYVHDLLDGVASAVESHSQVAAARGAILATVVCHCQRSRLFVC